jgi:hypothetical protein
LTCWEDRERYEKYFAKNEYLFNRESPPQSSHPDNLLSHQDLNYPPQTSHDMIENSNPNTPLEQTKERFRETFTADDNEKRKV